MTNSERYTELRREAHALAEGLVGHPDLYRFALEHLEKMVGISASGLPPTMVDLRLNQRLDAISALVEDVRRAEYAKVAAESRGPRRWRK